LHICSRDISLRPAVAKEPSRGQKEMAAACPEIF
jgi:hypothetical protein